ncbi:MAG: heme ABC exporter ATP-binding protein CcmA [Moraxella sp.]|nr:heme ABC exporter ATP-binding protein CcmA [Moraxella sp.]
MNILTLENVSVQRGEMVLCKNVSFALAAGEICHLLGENGLGKTTLLAQIVGLLPVLTGRVDYLNGQRLRALYVSHQTGVHEALTVRQNLDFLMALHGVHITDEMAEQALTMVGLAGFDDVSCGELSAGQGRRVGLARLWLTDAERVPLWLLDEPLTALDVAMVQVLEQRIVDFARLGGAVLLTSHQSLLVANRHLDLAEYVV